ncbi:hypothetical protein [Wenyingzhuangia sp. 2_MG-2023]|uniref:hypothetical protein n=1 Tax=Wenyingzhuangia sp. 2_MG-2023 TaxID=3062639 RepID=UPI0026E3B80F|nr:hypothetical protein [Wenyingzhuangia sp. 2_MG-2023]MDO6736534.1 hypothetical protein [Wenyingzhuangia sp. 2_MG-2023]
MKKQLLIASLFLGTISMSAQEEESTEIKKEDVVVEFSFSPTLSNVFKLKSTPNPTQEFPKKKVTYKINSKEVPSDFVPVAKKAVYVSVDDDKAPNYANYVYGAAGLYGNGEFELMLRPETSRKGYRFGVDLSSYNAQKGIEDERVNNGQWNANAGVFLAKEDRNYDWIGKLNYNRNQIHWYGLDENILASIYENQEVMQLYNTVDFSGALSFNKAAVKSVTPSIQFFSDDYNSSEIKLGIGTVLDKSLFKDFIELQVDLEYLNGSFDQNYAGDAAVNYSFINVGLTPKYEYQAKSFQLRAALGLFANIDQEASKSNFIFLPNIQTDILLLENIMTMHAGIRSELNQNSYASLVKQNPWISPTQTIKTSQTPVDVFLGLEGKLTKTVSYNTEISYQQTKDKVLFVHNNDVSGSVLAYQMGNSFRAIYDDVNVFSFKGTIESKFYEAFTGGVTGVFNSYSLDQEDEAWNLPNFTVETYANYTKGKFFGQLGLNFVGGRKDFVELEKVDVDGFVDINLKTAYKINDKLNVHVNVYNLLSNNYESYINYQVQGFQALGGLSYKF